MKKTLRFGFLSLALAFAGVSAQAQLDGNSPAPDWTLTDLDGTEHHLYEYLDQGKTVIIDFSATWCGPCWNYHNSHVMRDFYDQYGPAGTGEVMVFFIEGDASTTNADLHGTGSSTQGDWVTGTTYPIIDDASMTSAYEIGYWPTIYAICPDRYITEIGQTDLGGFVDFKNDCPTPSSGTALDIRPFGIQGFPESVCADDENATGQVKLQNYGTDAITSATIEVYANDDNLIGTTNWSGNLSTTYAISDWVDIPVTVPYWAGDLKVVVRDPNASADENMTNNEQSIAFSGAAKPDSPNLTVEVQADNYANEISWGLYSSTGSLVESGALTANDNGSLVTQDITVGVYDCYDFVVNDSYGDGILGGGYVRIVTDAGTEVLRVEGDDYGATTSRGVKIDHNITNVNEIAGANSLNVFPNPFAGIANVSYTLAEATDVKVDVYNVVGQVVYSEDFGTLSAGEQRFELDGSKLDAGMYVINLTVGDNTMTKRVSLNK